MFHVKHEGPGSVGVHLSPQQTALLRRYEELLREGAVTRGMIASSDLSRLWRRHILDGLRGVSLISPMAVLAYDLGSGAGLPGIPIAIGMPGLRVIVAEKRRSRAAFLELAVEELALANVVVHAGGAEELDPGADVCLARAFGEPSRCWEVAEPLLADQGVLLYWAGRGGDVRVEGVRTKPFFEPALADGGPVVMMARQ
jgi:16S rRNA (guanine527-N7)-methyltransferase